MKSHIFWTHFIADFITDVTPKEGGSGRGNVSIYSLSLCPSHPMPSVAVLYVPCVCSLYTLYGEPDGVYL